MTDNGTEFRSKYFGALCREMIIEHRVALVEAHRSNGRAERIIRTLRNDMLKCDKDDLLIKVYKVAKCYNSAYQSAKKQAPEEITNSDISD